MPNVRGQQGCAESVNPEKNQCTALQTRNSAEQYAHRLEEASLAYADLLVLS
jgi:hypothetical protein